MKPILVAFVCAVSACSFAPGQDSEVRAGADSDVRECWDLHCEFGVTQWLEVDNPTGNSVAYDVECRLRRGDGNGVLIPGRAWRFYAYVPARESKRWELGPKAVWANDHARFVLDCDLTDRTGAE